MAGYHVFDEEDLLAVKDVLDRGNLCSIGTDTFSEKFEQEFAAEFGSPLGLTIVNAMAGLHAGVAASGAGPGDEVICDPMVVFGALGIMYHNAIPIFADVDPDTHLVDPASLEANLTDRTRAIIVTQLWGLMADMDPIMALARKHGLTVIEDCAHAIYATYKGHYAGTVGDIGVFSFQQSKQMALGDGGMTLMRDPAKRQIMYDLTTFGTCPARLSWNYRMNEVVAAIGRVQLKRARGYVDTCIENASLLSEAVRGFEEIVRPQANPDPANRTHAYHIWAARYEGDKVGIEQETFKQACSAAGLSLNFGYIQQPAYRQQAINQQIAYGKDCPRGCGFASRQPDYNASLCPNAEYLMPRLILSGTGGDRAGYQQTAEKLRGVLERFA
ncbi:MAG: DegT/DnrJ/EryC1/StrS family aminotransferase [Armatimonadia bacterium]